MQGRRTVCGGLLAGEKWPGAGAPKFGLDVDGAALRGALFGAAAGHVHIHHIGVSLDPQQYAHALCVGHRDGGVADVEGGGKCAPRQQGARDEADRHRAQLE